MDLRNDGRNTNEGSIVGESQRLQGVQPEVLTLEEVAAFLRTTEQAVLDLLAEEGIPARKIGGEWRFLKQGIKEWLSELGEKPTPPRPGTREALHQAYGMFKDEPDFEEHFADLRRRRRIEGGT